MKVPRNKIREENNTPQQTTTSTPKFTDVEVKSYRDEAIEVLTILEKKGIDLYAEDRYGGMELRQNKAKRNGINEIFSKPVTTTKTELNFKDIFGI